MSGEINDNEEMFGHEKKSRLDELLEQLWGLSGSSELARAASSIDEATRKISDRALLSGESLSSVEQYETRMAGDHPPFDIPIPLPERYEVKQDPAKGFHEALQQLYAELKAPLGPDEQLVILYCDAGGIETVIQGFAFRQPELVLLKGKDRTIIANVNSLQLYLRVDKVEPENKRDIWFI